MYANAICCCHFGGIVRDVATDVHDVGCVLDHVDREDGVCLLVYHSYVIGVVVDGVVYGSEVVDVVGVVFVVIFVRDAESVVPRRPDLAFDDKRFLAVLLLFVVVSVSCC